MGTSSLFLCLDPLPSLPPMLHSHHLIIPAARYCDTRGNRWFLSNGLSSRMLSVLVLGFGRLTVGKLSAAAEFTITVTIEMRCDGLMMASNLFQPLTVHSVAWFAWRMSNSFRSRLLKMCNLRESHLDFLQLFRAHLLCSLTFLLRMSVPFYWSALVSRRRRSLQIFS